MEDFRVRVTPAGASGDCGLPNLIPAAFGANGLAWERWPDFLWRARNRVKGPSTVMGIAARPYPFW